jgi:hypothetical protein
VHPLDVPFTQAFKVVSKWGSGGKDLVAAMESGGPSSRRCRRRGLLSFSLEVTQAQPGGDPRCRYAPAPAVPRAGPGSRQGGLLAYHDEPRPTASPIRPVPSASASRAAFSAKRCASTAGTRKIASSRAPSPPTSSTCRCVLSSRWGWACRGRRSGSWATRRPRASSRCAPRSITRSPW